MTAPKRKPGHEYAGTTLTAIGDRIYGETPEDGIIARVYDAPRLAQQFAASDAMLRALRLAEPVLCDAVAAGVLPADDMSDRLALDAVQTAIAKAEGDPGDRQAAP